MRAGKKAESLREKTDEAGEWAEDWLGLRAAESKEHGPRGKIGVASGNEALTQGKKAVDEGKVPGALGKVAAALGKVARGLAK